MECVVSIEVCVSLCGGINMALGICYGGNELWLWPAWCEIVHMVHGCGFGHADMHGCGHGVS